ncbi:hypothetical protein LINPERPRIM_LOCUS25625 [Linum perenne]
MMILLRSMRIQSLPMYNKESFEDDVLEVDFDYNVLEFKSIDDAYDFYKDYAYSIGFDTKKRLSNKNNIKGDITDQVNYIYFNCTKHAYRSKSE